MSMTDPIADLLTRIRNANSNGYKTVNAPYSRVKKNILRVMKEQGYITEYESAMSGTCAVLNIDLKYGGDGEKVIQHIQRVSTPGRRWYVGAAELPDVLDGLGIAIVSTSKGVMSNLEAKKLGIGGEVLCEVW